MDADQWEKKYAARTAGELPGPARLLRENTRLFSGGTALDIAMVLSPIYGAV